MLRRPRRPPVWLITGILSLGGMLAAMQSTVVVPLLPYFPDVFDVAPEAGSWIVTVTLLTGAVAVPIVSRLADMFGKRRMILITLLVMAVGSLLLTIEGNFVTAIIGRGLQGFASAMMPVGISVLRDELPPERVGFGVALVSATMGIGAALGMPMAGLIYTHTGWSLLFVITAAFAMLVTLGVFLLVPESKIRTGGRFDYLGAVLLSVALAAFLLVISMGHTWEWLSVRVGVISVVSVVALGCWLPYQLRAANPLVDLRTTVRRPVLLTNIATVFIALGMFVNLLVAAQQLGLPAGTEAGFGLSVEVAGLVLAPPSVAVAVLSPFTGRLLTRYGGRAVFLFGTAITGITMVARVYLDNSVAEITIAMGLVGIGTAFTFAAMPVMIMSVVPITETASANGVNALFRMIATALSSALLTGIASAMTVTYQGRSYPAAEAFHVMFWICAVAALIAFVIVLFIPARQRMPSERGHEEAAEPSSAPIEGKTAVGREKE